MQAVARLKNISDLRSSLSFLTAQSSSFHSTPVSNEKWRKKWNADFKGGQQPSKNYIRYASRQKRADTKQALRNLLFHSDVYAGQSQSGSRSKRIDRNSSWDEEWEDYRPKTQSRRAQKAKSKQKRKCKKGFGGGEDDEHSETVFHATFGSRCYTWSFHSFDGGFSSESSTSGFEWKQNPFGEEERRYHHHESESDNDEKVVNKKASSPSDRSILGLPPYGPLKMVDVKNAFRVSALKWHPDKHQGASQAEAEEKFKLCVNAYNSLCSSLSTVA